MDTQWELSVAIETILSSELICPKDYNFFTSVMALVIYRDCSTGFGDI